MACHLSSIRRSDRRDALCTLSLILQASIMAAGDKTYDAAYHETAENGQAAGRADRRRLVPRLPDDEDAAIPQLEKQGRLEQV